MNVFLNSEIPVFTMKQRNKGPNSVNSLSVITI